MDIILKNKIILPDIPSVLQQDLMAKLSLENPKWIENNRLFRSNKGVLKTLRFYEETEEGFEAPRGFMRHLINACRFFNIDFTIVDERLSLEEQDFSFSGTLKPFQRSACNDILKKHFGVLTAPTGSGKTVMMLYMIAVRKQPTLIIVHTKDLAAQWSKRIETFLGIPEKEVGFIGGGKVRIGKKITVAMVQSLYKKTSEIAPLTGHIVVDECHRAPSRTFTEALKAFSSYYMTGLSATPFRRDKLSKLIFWHLGDVSHEVEKKHLLKTGDILHAEVIRRETTFKTMTDPVMYYGKVMTELTEDNDRNTLIAKDIAEESSVSNGVCLVLSDRKVHCERVQTMLKQHHGIDSDMLTGDLSRAERNTVLENVENNKTRILIATSQLLGEGFDSAKLSSLFLIYPIKFSGRLLQYLGRIIRPGDIEKKARVFDYADINVGVLEAAARSRMFVYNEHCTTNNIENQK